MIGTAPVRIPGGVFHKVKPVIILEEGVLDFYDHSCFDFHSIFI